MAEIEIALVNVDLKSIAALGHRLKSAALTVGALSFAEYCKELESFMETLRSLPFTELKIDQTFVRNACADPSSRAIIESSIQLGKILNLNLVAEGVETQVEWDLIATLGCVQGYFIAKPMPRAEFANWASHNNGG